LLNAFPIREGILADDKPVWLLCSPFCRVAAFALPGLQNTATSKSYAVSCRPAQAQRRRAISAYCTLSTV
ncbi:TPA: hypothetical protein ACOAXM_003681, partial [Vibrio cholerae]